MVHLGLTLTLICTFALGLVTGFPKFQHDLISISSEFNSKEPAPKVSGHEDIMSEEWWNPLEELEDYPGSYSAGDGRDGRSVYSSHQDVSKTFGQAHMPAHSLISPERILWGPHAGSLPKTNVVKRGSVVSTAKCKCDCKLDDGVCGRGQDGQLEYFPSKCAMECYACTHGRKYTLYRRGACPAQAPTTPRARPTFKPFIPPPTTRRPSPTPKCTCGCPMGKVLCAADKHGNKQTFGSECALTCYNCTHNADFRKIKNGDC